MAKIKFYNTDFVSAGGIDLTTIISLSNKQQTAEGFEAFINEVIKSYPAEIVHLDIILATELYRHYYGRAGAIAAAEEWFNTNQQYLNYLIENEIPYCVRSWSDLIDLPSYLPNLEKVTTLFNEDKIFLNIVTQLAEKFTEKNNINAKNAITFLLEECAVCLSLQGNLTYPHKELNVAILYVLERVGAQFNYIPYKVDYKKARSKVPMAEGLSPSHPLYQQMLTLRQTLEQYGIHGRDFQLQYYRDFCKNFEKKEKKKSASTTQSNDKLDPHRKEKFNTSKPNGSLQQCAWVSS